MFDKNTDHQQYFPQGPPSLQSRAITGNEIQLQYQHNHDIFPGHYLNAPQDLEVAVLFNDYYQDINAGKDGESSSMAGPPQKASVKKDRHSKIYTSQGPRDRRVRLSIDIARKFFDLQEMLGFDKPSKTLDWLLSKSEEAIQELVESKSGKSISNSYELEEVVSDSENGNSFGEDSKGKSVMLPKTRNISEKVNLAKESRAKARARARERTKEKMCIKQLNEARIRAREAPVLHYPISYISGFHQQNSSNGSENWDYSNFGSQSNQLCAILDQHKFIN